MLAILFWVYGVGQLLVFDFDGWLIAWLPDGFRWIVIYKLLVFLFLTAVVLKFVPRSMFWSWAAYVVLYPVTRLLLLLKLLGWVLIMLKSWTVLIAVLNAALGFFGSFKTNLLIYVVAMIGMVTALAARLPGDLVSAAILLIAVIVVLVVRQLVVIFRPSPIFNVYVRAIARIMDFSRRNLIKPASLRGVDTAQITLTELEARYGQLSTGIFLSELCEFMEVRFREYRASGTAIATNLLALVGLLGFVIFLLGFANLALYRADQLAFRVTDGHGLFDFGYYAFCAVTSQHIAEIVPVSLGAKLISMLETMLGWIFFAGTALSLVLSVTRDQDNASIERAINRLREERQRMNTFVEEGFALPLDEAVGVLEGIKGGLSSLIKLFRTARGG